MNDLPQKPQSNIGAVMLSLRIFSSKLQLVQGFCSFLMVLKNIFDK